jgi:hypothetical protein
MNEFGYKLLFLRFKKKFDYKEEAKTIEAERDVDFCVWYTKTINIYKPEGSEADLEVIKHLTGKKYLKWERDEYLSNYGSAKELFNVICSMNLHPLINEYEEWFDIFEEAASKFLEKPPQVMEKSELGEDGMEELVGKFTAFWYKYRYYIEKGKSEWIELLSSALEYLNEEQLITFYAEMLENLKDLELTEDLLPRRKEIEKVVLDALKVAIKIL